MKAVALVFLCTLVALLLISFVAGADPQPTQDEIKVDDEANDQYLADEKYYGGGGWGGYGGGGSGGRGWGGGGRGWGGGGRGGWGGGGRGGGWGGGGWGRGGRGGGWGGGWN